MHGYFYNADFFIWREVALSENSCPQSNDAEAERANLNLNSNVDSDVDQPEGNVKRSLGDRERTKEWRTK